MFERAGKLGIEAVDRYERRSAPSPIYEEDSVIARILDGKNAKYFVPLPKKIKKVYLKLIQKNTLLNIKLRV